MADKKENELTSESDFAYVRALDSAGNSIRISKADLVSVVEGLMPGASVYSKGLMTSDMYKTMYMSKVFEGEGLIKICDNDGFFLMLAVVMAGVGFGISISNTVSGSQYIKAGLICDTALGESSFSLYKDSEGVYLWHKSNCTLIVLRSSSPRYLRLEESSKQISQLEKIDIK